MNSRVTTIGTERDPARRLAQAWGRRIAEVRKLRGLSRGDLAEVCEVSEAAVGMWERGETTPRPHVQAAIARALDTPHSVIFEVAA